MRESISKRFNLLIDDPILISEWLAVKQAAGYEIIIYRVETPDLVIVMRRRIFSLN